MRALVLSVAALAALLLPAAAIAQPTDITVRVLGKDSKFIGTSMGGARIILRDAETGEVLASGSPQPLSIAITKTGVYWMPAFRGHDKRDKSSPIHPCHRPA